MVLEILGIIACLYRKGISFVRADKLLNSALLRRLLARILFLPLFLFLALPLSACRPAAEAEKESEPPLRLTAIDSFHISILPTAGEQLAHARSGFLEVREKVAALKAVALLYPADRRHAAMAALELAYLELGPDYRLADVRQREVAMEKYQEVINAYRDLPEIVAKSLWYLGWIACDLLDDTFRGLIFYQRIVDEYSHEGLNYLPPAPWLTIRSAEGSMGQPPSYPKPGLAWVDVAHLEIIRNVADRERAWRSLLAIRESHGDDAFTGMALGVLLIKHGFEERSEQLTRSYLAMGPANQAIKNDLQLALSAHLREVEEKGAER